MRTIRCDEAMDPRFSSSRALREANIGVGEYLASVWSIQVQYNTWQYTPTVALIAGTILNQLAQVNLLH
jgi:hypothetical protein